MLRRIGMSLLAILLTMGLTQLPAEAAGKPPVTFPKKPKGLKPAAAQPKELDPTPAYTPQVSCNPVDLVGAKKLRKLVLKTYKVGGKGAISHGCTEGLSEHSEGRAWDWMVNVKKKKEKKAAADFLAWVTAKHGKNARRLGIMYVIYNKKIWAVYREKDGWRKSYDHVDHIHISFSWNGARAKTSFWTGKVQPTDYGPCARFAHQPAVLRTTARLDRCYSEAVLVKKHKKAMLKMGSRTSSVKTAQSALGMKKNGVFDKTMWKKVKTYQLAHDLPYTGVIDVPTWSSLRPKDMSGDVSKGYSAKEAAAYGLKNYSEKTIYERNTGKAVLFAQVALGVTAKNRNGYFGAHTKTAVKKFQKAHGLNETGTVTKAEWTALAGS